MNREALETLAQAGDRTAKAKLALLALLEGEVPVGAPPQRLEVEDGVIKHYNLPAKPEIIEAIMNPPIQLRVEVWNCRWQLVLRAGDEEFTAEDLGLSKEDENEFCRMVVEDEYGSCITWSGTYYPSVRALRWLAERLNLI